MKFLTRTLITSALFCGFLQTSKAENHQTEDSKWLQKFNVKDELSIKYLNGEIKGKGTGAKPFNRYWSQYYERAYPNGEIPPNYILNEYEKLKKVMPGFGKENPDRLPYEIRNGKYTTQINDAASWSEIGPTNQFGGVVTCLAINPINPDILYLGAEGGGVWKTLNGGQNWLPLDNDLPNQTMGAIALNPNNPDSVLIGIGGTNNLAKSTNGGGILVSNNGGATWDTTNFANDFATNSNFGIYKIVFEPNNTNIVFTATQKGLYQSADGGFHWNQIPIYGQNNKNIVDFEFKVGDPSIALCAINKDKIYRSTDFGNTWLPVKGLPTTNVGRIEFSWGTANGYSNEVFAIISDKTDGSTLGIWKSTNSGKSWFKTSDTSNILGKQGWGKIAIITDRGHHNKIYAGGLDFWKSTNGGNTFVKKSVNGYNGGVTSTSMHVDQLCAIQHPTNSNIFYIGNDGGVFKTTDDFETFTSLNNDLGVADMRSVALHPTNTNFLIGGAMHDGIYAYHGGNTKNWTKSYGGDGGKSIIDYSNPTICYANTQYINPIKSTNSANNFNSIKNGINVNDDKNFFMPLVIDPIYPNCLYTGTDKIYRTTNSGNSWDSLTVVGDLTNGKPLNSIGISPTNSNFVYTGSSDGRVMMSTDAFGNNNINLHDISTGFGLPTRSITSIAVSPINPQKIYVTFSSFNDAISGHVFKCEITSVDTTWSDITPNVMNHPVNSIVVDNAYPDFLYIGTDLGVFFSPDDGVSWYAFDDGLPKAVVNELKIHQATGTLYVATNGRGIWKTQLTRANLAESVPSGWDYSLVARNTNDATNSNCQASSELFGNSNSTYFNWAVKNYGTGQAATHKDKICVDGKALQTWTLGDIGSGAEKTYKNAGPFTIKGGRHFVSDSIDALNEAGESNENDNLIWKQYVWSPQTLSNKNSILSTSPPLKKYKNEPYWNCDGYSFNFGNANYGPFAKYWIACAVLPTTSDADVDLRLYNDYEGSDKGFEQHIKSSSYSEGQIDFTLVTRREELKETYEFGVINENNTNENYVIEAVKENGKFYPPCSIGNSTISANSLIEIYELYFSSSAVGKEFTFNLDNISGNADLGFSLHFDNDEGFFSRGNYFKNNYFKKGYSYANGDGQDEQFTIQVNESGYYCLAVWKKDSESLAKSATYSIQIDEVLTKIVSESQVPVTYSLEQNFPNPFNPSTKIKFGIPEENFVKIKIFDILGREIKSLVNEKLQPAFYTVQWNGDDSNGKKVSSGIYFYKLETEKFSETKKLTILK